MRNQHDLQIENYIPIDSQYVNFYLITMVMFAIFSIFLRHLNINVYDLDIDLWNGLRSNVNMQIKSP